MTVADGLAATLVVEGATTYSSPPLSLNVPALVVGYPETVELNTAMGLDTATIPVVCVVGFADPPSRMGTLIAAARAAVSGDRKLAGAAALARLSSVRTMRADKVGGIDVLICDLVMTVEC